MPASRIIPKAAGTGPAGAPAPRARAVRAGGGVGEGQCLRIGGVAAAVDGRKAECAALEWSRVYNDVLLLNPFVIANPPRDGRDTHDGATDAPKVAPGGGKAKKKAKREAAKGGKVAAAAPSGDAGARGGATTAAPRGDARRIAGGVGSSDDGLASKFTAGGGDGDDGDQGLLLDLSARAHLYDAVDAHNGKQPAERRQVWYPTGDALDRAAVTQALWTRREAIAAAKRAYLVVAWRAGDQALTTKRGGSTGEIAKIDHSAPPASVNVACFVYDTPPQPSRSSFHTDLRHLYDTVDHSQRIPVVVVDPGVRRNHHYTYLVVVAYPWVKEQPENP